MCGLAGAVGGADAEPAVRRMLAAMQHRGPDGGGVAVLPGAALGMVRLQVRPPATLTLPPVAAGRAVAFNGEVYGTLPPGGPPVVTVGDELTVLLADRPDRVDGMWALVVPAAGGLVLSRDRWGLRPLYYARRPRGGWAVASELAALAPEAGRPAPAADPVTEALALGAPVTADTLYAGVASVPPGGTVELTPAGALVHPPAADPAGPVSPDDPDVAGRRGSGRLAAALSASIGRMLATERPVGLALSGGLDSALVARELAGRRVRDVVTVSVLVPGTGDGVRAAAEVVGAGADGLGWRHVTTEVDRYRYLELLAPAVAAMGYPTRMSSVPLYLALAERAAEAGVVVLLTGEGADELFLGYSSYARWTAAGDADPVDRVERVHLPEPRRRHLARLAGPARAGAVRASYREAARGCVADPQGPLRALERRLSLGPLLDRTDLCLMARSVEGRAPFLHGEVPAVAAAYSDAELVGAAGKAPLRRLARSGTGSPVATMATAAKRPFRAPLRAWLAEDDRRWTGAVRARVRSGCRKLDYAAAAGDALLAEAPADDEAAALVGALLAVDAWAALR